MPLISYTTTLTTLAFTGLSDNKIVLPGPPVSIVCNTNLREVFCDVQGLLAYNLRYGMTQYIPAFFPGPIQRLPVHACIMNIRGSVYAGYSDDITFTIKCKDASAIACDDDHNEKGDCVI